MNAPQYMALGGVIFTREHHPMTLERARHIEAVHRINAAYWLGADHYSDTARIGLAKVEQSLADEMAEAIREATAQPLEQAA